MAVIERRFKFLTSRLFCWSAQVFEIELRPLLPYSVGAATCYGASRSKPHLPSWVLGVSHARLGKAKPDTVYPVRE